MFRECFARHIIYNHLITKWNWRNIQDNYWNPSCLYRRLRLVRTYSLTCISSEHLFNSLNIYSIAHLLNIGSPLYTFIYISMRLSLWMMPKYPQLNMAPLNNSIIKMYGEGKIRIPMMKHLARQVCCCICLNSNHKNSSIENTR